MKNNQDDPRTCIQVDEKNVWYLEIGAKYKSSDFIWIVGILVLINFVIFIGY